ncbi:hypothetical protein CRYUN_Cryun06bG0116000 [Craigia yunnanensis]
MELRGLTLLVLVLFFCIAQVSSETKIEENQHTQIVKGCARRGAACTQGKTCAQEHVEPVAPGANVFLQAPQGTKKCVEDAILT